MNDKNNALFFNEDNDFNAVITLTDEDGNDMDMEAVAALEIHELGKEYIAVALAGRFACAIDLFLMMAGLKVAARRLDRRMY